MLLTELQGKLILLCLQSTIYHNSVTLFGSLLTGCLIKATQANLFVPAFTVIALWKLAWWGAQQCKTTFGKTSTRVIHTDLYKPRLWGNSSLGTIKTSEIKLFGSKLTKLNVLGFVFSDDPMTPNKHKAFTNQVLIFIQVICMYIFF